MTPDDLDRIEAHLKAHLVNPFWLSETQQANMDLVLRLIAALRAAWRDRDLLLGEQQHLRATARQAEATAEVSRAAEREACARVAEDALVEFAQTSGPVGYRESWLIGRVVDSICARAKDGDSG